MFARLGGSFFCATTFSVAFAACLLGREGQMDPGSVNAAPGAGGATQQAGTAVGGMDNQGGGSTQGGMGGGSVTVSCGDGMLDENEACDDANDNDPEDGCHNCVIGEGFTCSGQPSQCEPIQPLIATVGPTLHLEFKGDAYDGKLESMTCVELPITAPPAAQVQTVSVELALTSNYVGDLVIKVVHPYPEAVTLMSRPGMNEPADDGSGNDSDGSDLSATYPVTFYDGAPHSAEAMGSTIGDSETVCEDDNQCEFAPNSGAAAGGDLSAFKGLDADGTWRICVADADGSNGGYVEQATLRVLAW